MSTMDVVAWRGNSSKFLENTRESVAGVPDWVNLVEIDTRLTSDGVMVAYHSPTMSVHGDYRCISDIPYAEISEKRIHHKKVEYSIPRVSDLVNDFPTKQFILHIKREADVDKYVQASKLLPRDCLFHSNSESHLLAVLRTKRCKGTYKSVYKPADIVLDYVDGYMCGHRAFMPVSALEDWWLAALRKTNKRILVFASMSKDWMEEVVEFDVDGFLTGRFDRAAEVLGV